MKEWRRWLDDGRELTPFERAVFRSGRNADPPKDAEGEVWAGVAAQLGLPPGGPDGSPDGGGADPGEGGSPGQGGPGGDGPGLGADPGPDVGPSMGDGLGSGLGEGAGPGIAEGIAGGVAKGAAGSATALGGAAVATKGAATTGLAGVGVGVLAKWVGIGAVVGGATVVATELPTWTEPMTPQVVDAPSSPQPASSTETIVPSGNFVPRATASVVGPSESAMPPGCVPGDEHSDHVEAMPAGSTSGTVQTPPPTDPNVSRADRMREEASLLKRAREALRTGNPHGALGVIAESQKRFPRSLVSQEREAIAIEALWGAGRHAEAQARAQAFLRHYPKSPHTERIRVFAEGAGKHPNGR